MHAKQELSPVPAPVLPTLEAKSTHIHTSNSNVNGLPSNLTLPIYVQRRETQFLISVTHGYFEMVKNSRKNRKIPPDIGLFQKISAYSDVRSHILAFTNSTCHCYRENFVT